MSICCGMIGSIGFRFFWGMNCVGGEIVMDDGVLFDGLFKE